MTEAQSVCSPSSLVRHSNPVYITLDCKYWLAHGLHFLSGYLGLKFSIHGQFHYGWARLNVFTNWNAPGFTAALLGYAYETIPNKPIITGKTKGPDVITIQPATLGHLARGATFAPTRSTPNSPR